MIKPALRRAVVVMLAVPLVQAAVVAAPTVAPAHADSVATAQARVARLQHLLDTTTHELVLGTREWQRDQAQLQSFQAQVKVLNARIAQQEAVAAAGQARISQLARRMYMQPAGQQLQMAIAMSPQQVLGLLQTQDDLTRVSLSDADVVRQAKAAKVQLDASRHAATSISLAARLVAQRSAAKLATLNALASRTTQQLGSAINSLSRARAAEAERLARVAADRASRFRAMTGPVGAGCQTGSTAGMGNGNLDPSVLCPLWMAPGMRLRTDAAHAFNRMSQYHMRLTHRPLCVNDSYRSYAQQVDVYHRKPDLAAVPGTSNHGWGLAVDLGCGAQTFGTPEFQWLKRYAGQFGFHHPAWAEPHGSKPEPWHWEFGTHN